METIECVVVRVCQLVFNVMVVVVHGQMLEIVLEWVMFSFMVGYVDVLVCTIIVESGLDVLCVNIMVIYCAD